MSMTADELSEYDAETVRLTVSAEQRIAAAEAEACERASEAKAAKKRAKEEGNELRRMIREREEQRGKRPAPTILDLIPKAAAAWRRTPVAKLAVSDAIKAHLSFEPVKTAGELFDEIASFNPADGAPFGLPLCDVAEIRMHLAELADREAESAPMEAAQVPMIPDYLWRSYPVSRWTRFGLTAKDVEKLAEGVVKRETDRRPVRTVGDLSNFTAPTGTGYSRQYADIKGIGAAGADRLSDAEGRFWGWWKGSGEEEFARERGLIRGDATVAGTGIRAAGAAAGAADPNGDAADLERYADDGAPAAAE